MADNKLLGVLELNPGKVIDTINQVNSALQNLGKGVDLDLTNILNSKVNSQLKELKQQISDIGKATTGNTSAEKKASDDQLRILEAQAANLRNYGKQRQQQEKEYSNWWNTELNKRDKMELASLEMKAADLRAYGKQQEQIRQQQIKDDEAAARLAAANAKKMQDYRKQWANYAVSALGAASLAVLKKQWTEAVSYATKYYDALNEIRVVTGMSEQDANRMGQNMRNLAEEMKVTSTELSEAAITFYRQGLSDSEVQDRLKWVTEYAKVAHMEFSDAAQLMTAAINTMGDSIQKSGFENVVEHIADVWLYLGDNAATSGEEIGKAMQKASASATEFGMSFEWLGTYIAVVAEQTRQAPEAIGNAFNTMLARMHQIKSTGFNTEDTTKLNDVAKALATINVELTDSEGQWRDMNLIYEDVASAWGNLDAKTKGYLATTMAGTRQQNVFYALMNDMSKGIEGGSRAWELYTGAMNAAGTATQKYAVYQESIEASQADMQNSLEQLYSNLQPDLIKGFYGVVTSLVDGLNKLGGTFPIVIAGAAGLTAAIIGVNAALNPLVVVAGAAAAILGTLIGLGGLGALFGGDSAQKFEKATASYEEAGKQIQNLQSLQKKMNDGFAKSQSDIGMAKSEIDEYNGVLEAISKVAPEAQQVVEQLKGGFVDQAEAVSQLNGILDDYIEKQKEAQKSAAWDRLSSRQLPQEYNNRDFVQVSGKDILSYLSQYGYNYSVDSLFSAADTALAQILPDKQSQLIQNALSLYMKSALDNLGDSLFNYGLDEQKTKIGSMLFTLLREDIFNGEDNSKKLAEEMNAWINDALLYAGDLDPATKQALKSRLTEAIIGDDGVLTPKDFSDNIKSQIQMIVADVVSQGSEAFTNKERLGGIFDFLFEDGALKDSYLSYFEDEINSIAESDDITNDVVNAFSSLVERGLSKAHLINILENMSLSDLGDRDMSDILTEYVGNVLFGFEDIQDFLSLFTKETTEGFVELNNEALILMANLFGGDNNLQSFVDTFSDQKIKNVDDFVAALKGLNTIKTEPGGQGEDNVITSLKEFVEQQNIVDAAKKVKDLIPLYNAGKISVSEFTSAVGDLIGERGEEEGLADYFSRATQALSNFGKEANKSKLSFDEFKSFAEQAEKAKEALDKLTDEKGISPSDQKKQQGILNEIFGDFNLEELEDTDQYISRATELVNQFISAVTTEALNHGDYGQGVIKFFSDLGGVIEDDSLSKQMSAIDSLKSALETIGNLGDAGVSDVLKALDQIKEAGTTLGADLMPMEGEDGIAYYQRLTEAVEEYTQAQHEAMLASLNLTEEQYQQMLKEQEAAKAAKEAAEEAKKAEEERLEGYRDLLKEMRNAEANTKAGKANYADQLNLFSSDLNKGGAKAVVSAWDSLGKTNKEMQTAIQQRFPQFAKAVAQAAVATGDLTEETSALDEALQGAQEQAEKFTQLDQVKYLQETASEVKKLAEDNGDLTKAFETFYSESQNVIEAQEEYAKISEQAGGVSKATADDVQKLVKALGWPAESILKNWDLVGAELDNAGTEIDDLYSQLQKDAILRITGTSEADFSNIESGLFSVAADAEQTIAALAALGAYEVDEEELEATMPLFDTVNGKTARVGDIQAMGTQKILRWPKVNGAGGSTGNTNTKGGGGGGGGNKTKTTSASTKALDRMERVQTLQDHTRSLYSAQAGYYEQTGQIDLVIKYHQKEMEAIRDKNATLEENIAELEDWIAKKREEIAALDEASEEYETAQKELDALEDKHREYTLAVIENKTELESLKETIKELNNEVRDMQIDLYDEVVAALEARDAAAQERLEGTISVQEAILDVIESQKDLEENMLSGRVSMENTVFGIIQAQAETQKKALQARVSMENTILGLIQAQVSAEQSLIGAVVSVQNAVANMIKSQVDAQKSMKQARSSMEDMLSGIVKSNLEAQASAASAAGDAADANQAQIEALREQKELLDEQLRLRKEMAKEQDRQAELAELEAQYARISADPTRLKEAMKIRQKIDKIRDEIAWDIAEKEVEEQKKAIDEQIDALSASSGGGGGSSSYEVNMNEVNSQVENILDTMSDEEIIEWLKDHSPDYENATKIGKELMVQEWQAALDEMHGISENYADEVAEVMAMSDEEMMEWFKTNSIEYQTATAERRIQMETEWQKMLDDMHGKTETYAEEVSSIMEMSDAEMMEWFKNTSVEYQNASSSRRAQMEAEWQEMLDEMHGKTETYAEEIAEVLNKPREEILQWLMENDEEYAHASDAQKQELVDGWNETLDTMYGTSEDHWTQVNAIMAGGLESFLNFMRTNDEEYAKMSAEQKQKTEQEWTDMWNQMIGEQKSYEEEANAIIAQGQDAIIELLGEYTTKYQNVGAQQSQAYLDEWMDKLAKLKAAISDVESLETKAYEYTQPEATPEAGSGSEKAEEAKKGWRVEANWSNVFASKAEAEAFKQSRIAAIQEQLNANPNDANLQSRLDTWKSSPINMYAKGGMNYRTGLAWLDGTPEDPERILSPYQTELFEILVHSMEEMSRVSIPMLPSFGGEFMTGGNNSSLSFGDIIVQVEHLDSDTDYDDMAEHILDSVMEKINRSAVVGGIRFSK